MSNDNVIPIKGEKTLSVADSAEAKAARVEEQMAKAAAIIPNGAGGPAPMAQPADGISDREKVQFRQNSINFAVAYSQHLASDDRIDFDLIATADMIAKYIVDGQDVV